MQGRERDGTKGGKAGIVPDQYPTRGRRKPLNASAGVCAVSRDVGRSSVGASTPFDAGLTVFDARRPSPIAGQVRD
jgi:hypothetical protein